MEVENQSPITYYVWRKLPMHARLQIFWIVFSSVLKSKVKSNIQKVRFTCSKNSVKSLQRF